MMNDIGADYKIEKIKPEYNSAIAKLIRLNLKNHNLDISGTAYYDSELDNLSDFYSNYKKRGYYILINSSGCVVGGIGFAEVPFFEDCAELQKLYLADSEKGFGLGYKLINFIEEKMIEAGYTAAYLETHYNLQAAIHIYEKSGYSKIDRPKDVAHGAMTHFYYKKL